jgi:hypothetical protein
MYNLVCITWSEYAVTSIFKSNAALHNDVVDLRTLSKDMTKDDHVIIVGDLVIALI